MISNIIECVLMHVDIPVVKLYITGRSSEIIKVGELYNEKHLPIGVTCKNAPDLEDLNDWWEGRSIPASRDNLKEALRLLGVKTTGELVNKSLGLSLSDHYWIKPVNTDLSWSNINFYENDFSEDVGAAFLDGKLNRGVKLNTRAPDNTADGIQPKRYKINDGKRVLYKRGREILFQEPFNEVIAYKIADLIGINHTKYDLVWSGQIPESVCEIFTSARVELVSIYNIQNTKKIEVGNSWYEHTIKILEDLKIKHAREDIEKMLVLDFIICNRDRHFNNFGILRNPVTLEWYEMAPVYDSGNSLWSNLLKPNYSTDEITAQSFTKSHAEQIKLVKDFSWLDMNKLDEIENIIRKIIIKNEWFQSGERLDLLCEAVNKRVSILKQLTVDSG